MSGYNYYGRRSYKRGLPEHWFTEGVDPNKLSPHSIENDRWDREDLDAMRKDVAEFSAARRSLGDFASTGEEAMEDMFFSLLKADPRLAPEDEIKPANLVNRKIMELATELDEYDHLRNRSVNDDVQAAMACVEIEPDLETLFDQTEQQRKDAAKLQQALQALYQAKQDQHDLDDVVRRWTQDNPEAECPTCEGTGVVQPPKPDGEPGGEPGGDDGEGQPGEGEGNQPGEGDQPGQGQGQPGDGHGEGGEPCPTCAGTGCATGQPGEGEGQPGQPGSANGPGRPDKLTDEQKQQMDDLARQQRELAEKLAQAEKDAQAAKDEFEDGMDRNKATMQNGLAKAFERAAEQADTLAETAMAWGLEPGALTHLNATERIEMARKLNSPRFKRIADLFGPMRNLMLTEQSRRTVHTTDEIYDVEMGKDLGRMVPSELLALDDELTELDFLRRYQEGALLQYAMQGEEKLARGGIIVCEDGSGSMSGERELWAKAVMLCLLHLARQQKRSFRLIHFGSVNQYKVIEFTEPSHFTMDRIMEAASIFFAGGTDFSTPMKQALGFLQDDHAKNGEVKADIVFVTDDECYVDQTFMDEYLSEMDRMQASTWGISVAGGRGGPREGALNSMTKGHVAQIKDLTSGEDIRDIFRGV